MGSSVFMLNSFEHEGLLLAELQDLVPEIEVASSFILSSVFATEREVKSAFEGCVGCELMGAVEGLREHSIGRCWRIISADIFEETGDATHCV